LYFLTTFQIMAPETTTDEDRVRIFDTTLRDGEQSPGCTMDEETKIQIARSLADLNVDIIEAGFPIASPGDFNAVKRIATEIRGPIIAGLARCLPEDITRAGKATALAEKRRIHVFIGTSPVHREEKLHMTVIQIIDALVRSIKQALTFTTDVEFSPEDAGRTEDDVLKQVVAAALSAGARTVNIPDTVGYCWPGEYGDKIAMVRAVADSEGGKDAIVSVHCHNDLGLAVANSIAGMQHGARQVECSINGIGERSGNASLEEIVMALRTRKDAFGLYTGIETKRLLAISQQVAHATFPIQRNKAIVGDNAFAHEAGIHQDGMLKARSTYEIMRPEDVGRDGSTLVLGKHSGMSAVADRFKQFELPYKKNDHAVFSKIFKAVADSKAMNNKYVTDDELLQDVYFPAVVKMMGTFITKVQVTDKVNGRIAVILHTKDGTQIEGVASDEEEGEIDAIMNGMRKIIPNVEIPRDGFKTGMEGKGSNATAVSTFTIQNDYAVTQSAAHKNTQTAERQALIKTFNALYATEKYKELIAEAQE